MVGVLCGMIVCDNSLISYEWLSTGSFGADPAILDPRSAWRWLPPQQIRAGDCESGGQGIAVWSHRFAFLPAQAESHLIRGGLWRWAQLLPRVQEMIPTKLTITISHNIDIYQKASKENRGWPKKGFLDQRIRLFFFEKFRIKCCLPWKLNSLR